SLDIVTAAFGLASITYTQWNSRLLISIEQSTVQEVVYTSQQAYREKIKTWPIPDRPTAIYLLRNYLRLCMPITIEANINTTTRLVQRGAGPDVANNLVVGTTTRPRVARITSVTTSLERIEPPPRITSEELVGRFEQQMSAPDMASVLNTLCVKAKN